MALAVSMMSNNHISEELPCNHLLLLFSNNTFFVCLVVTTVLESNDMVSSSGSVHSRSYSLCDWFLVIRGHVDDLVAFLSEDVQHAVVPQEVT